MKFDPNRVEENKAEDWDDPRGYFVRSSDFDEMKEWWEARGEEIERLEKIIKGVSELCDSL